MKSTRSDWLIPAGLIALSLVPALAGTARLAQVRGGVVTPENARFLAMPAPIVVHVVGAVLYSIVGSIQFSPALRRRNRAWHRMAGRVLLPAGFAVALSGLWMTLAYPWPRGDGVGVFLERLSFGAAMLVFLSIGTYALFRKKYSEHGDWMIRAYAIGLGAGTQVLTHLPWFILVDLKPGETPRAVMMGLGWIINVAFAEWVIRKPALNVRQAPRDFALASLILDPTRQTYAKPTAAMTRMAPSATKKLTIVEPPLCENADGQQQEPDNEEPEQVRPRPHQRLTADRII